MHLESNYFIRSTAEGEKESAVMPKYLQFLTLLCSFIPVYYSSQVLANTCQGNTHTNLASTTGRCKNTKCKLISYSNCAASLLFITLSLFFQRRQHHKHTHTHTHTHTQTSTCAEGSCQSLSEPDKMINKLRQSRVIKREAQLAAKLKLDMKFLEKGEGVAAGEGRHLYSFHCSAHLPRRKELGKL